MASLDDDNFDSLLDEKLSHLDKLPSIKVRAAKDEFDSNVLLMRRKRVEKSTELRTRAIRIKRDFIMNGQVEELNKPVDKEILRTVIVEMTEDINQRITTIKLRITLLIEKMLRQYIPQTLKIYYKLNGTAFVKHPGFTYEASKYYGGYKLLIQPNIPNVFTSPTEMEILRSRFTSHLNTVDRLVEKYYDMCKYLTTTETKMAIKLSKVKTVSNLIDLNVVYYEIYKKNLDKKQNAGN